MKLKPRWAFGGRKPSASWACQSKGFRFFRSDHLDDLPSPEAPRRDERLRELVDELPHAQRVVIERTFFGVATINEVAEELGVSGKTARAIRRQAFESLREVLEA